MVKKVLLCPPKYYQIEYSINPWMNLSNQVDKEKAVEEFNNLVKVYQQIGLEVSFLPPAPYLPDMVYAANCGFVINDLFIKANFKFPQRQKEADLAEVYFKKQGFKIAKLSEDIPFEGQGDLFYRDGKFFLGFSQRTSPKAKKYLEKILAEEIITFDVSHDPYFYHLDTCFAPLGKGVVVVRPDSFTKQDREKLNQVFAKVILTNGQDDQSMAANMLVNSKAVVVGQGISRQLRRALEREDFVVFEVPMTEFLKGGGSVKCLTQEFYD